MFVSLFITTFTITSILNPGGFVNHKISKWSRVLLYLPGWCIIMVLGANQRCIPMLDSLAPASPEQAEQQALASMLAEFDDTGVDARKIQYLQHRYAGFGKKESATLAGVKTGTVSNWMKFDPRMVLYDGLVSTGQRKQMRKDVLQEEWYKNFYLVLNRDGYILKKVHGLLDEDIWAYNTAGKLVKVKGSPPMTKEDWDYFTAMRKMYTPDAWDKIEKVVSGKGGDFNIDTFIVQTNQTHIENQQLNNGVQNGNSPASSNNNLR